MDKRIGIIGFGAIGTEVSRRICDGRLGPVSITLLLRPSSHPPLPEGIEAVTTLEDLLARHPQLVVEAASHQAVVQYAEACLMGGTPLMITSVGALADNDLQA